MSYSRPSSDNDRVSPVNACLVAAYGVEFRRGTCAETDPLLMMRPPRGCWLFIMRNACYAHRNEPVRLTATTFDHCARVRSSIGMLRVLMPALLNNRSMRPYVALTVSNSAAIDAGSDTS